MMITAMRYSSKIIHAIDKHYNTVVRALASDIAPADARLGRKFRHLIMELPEIDWELPIIAVFTILFADQFVVATGKEEVLIKALGTG